LVLPLWATGGEGNGGLPLAWLSGLRALLEVERKEVLVPEIQMRPVNSSFVVAVGYDEDRQELHVKVKRGRNRYFVYMGVPPEVFGRLTEPQKSVGAFFVNEIKPEYAYRLGEEEHGEKV
jgi:hypothetical protein